LKNYPDIKEIIKNKAAHRRYMGALPFEEKLEIVFRLRDRKKLIKSGQGMKRAPEEIRAERPTKRKHPSRIV